MVYWSVVKRYQAISREINILKEELKEYERQERENYDDDASDIKIVRKQFIVLKKIVELRKELGWL
jgi:hypothetical protein